EDTGPLFQGMFRFVEFSVNVSGPTASTAPLPGAEAVSRQLEAIRGFGARHFAERDKWRTLIADRIAAGDHPVLWGAGSRGVQFLHLADPDGKLAAVVDVNARKWGRFLPVTGHEVTAPATLAGLGARTVIITNPAYRGEIGESLRALGVDAELLVA
ncbi:MAG TPA: hypothetical protein VGP16_03665, partial [Asanoa sp.]|nr:hypothetical protein [Asanoa sp.]